jgi:enamine deaminase RidA (YjgF/YER057c/UK114 family)
MHNGTVYLAGMTATNTIGQSVAAQTEEVLAKIDGYLKGPEPTNPNC